MTGPKRKKSLILPYFFSFLPFGLFLAVFPFFCRISLILPFVFGFAVLVCLSFCRLVSLLLFLLFGFLSFVCVGFGL